MLVREWFSAAEFAAMTLPGLPTTERNIHRHAEQANWLRPEWRNDRWREREGRGGGVEYHYTVLPLAAVTALSLKLSQVEAKDERENARKAMTREDMWAWYDALPANKKAKAERKLEVLDAVRAVVQSGHSKVAAMTLIAAKVGVNRDTLYAWESLTHGIERHDWLPYLAPRHAGSVGRAATECDAEAWDILKADYLRPSEPTFESCYRRLKGIADEKGWKIPSARTMQRRIDAIPLAVRVLMRKGEEALKTMIPAQERDRTVFHAMEAVNTDGHVWDVAVRWEDGVVSRPIMVGFQDLYSGMMLSWRLDRTENSDLVRLAFGDMVERYGIPEHCWADNGRAFMARIISGGMTRRFRFKMLEQEPLGIMTTLGVQLHNTNPYSGRSKPIERAWKDFCANIAKHPACEGAYLGNSPVNKPANYGSRVMDIADFRRLLAQGVEEHNSRLGRESAVCKGRSFRQAFEESYEKHTAKIRTATAEQRRVWLLAAQKVTVTRDSAVKFMGNRYSAEWMMEHVGKALTMRFDPDNLHADAYLYRLDGAFLGAAPCLEKVGFADTGAARQNAQNVKAVKRAVKDRAAAEKRLTDAELGRLYLREEAPAPYTPPAQTVVRPTFGNTALKPVAVEMAEEEAEDDFDRLMRIGREKQRAAQGGPSLTIIGKSRG